MKHFFSLRRSRAAVVACASVLAVASVAELGAHDFWIEPSAFRPKVGALVGLRLLVGQNMLGDPVAREPETIREFVSSLGTGRKPVPGRDGGDPAGILRVDAAGLLVVGYQSLPRPVELTPEKFDQYLGEEGLDEIRALGPRAAKRDAPTRELFARCAKTLLLGGGAAARNGGDGDRVLGLTFEIVAERNPYTTAPGQDLPFVLTYEGKRRAGALVVAISQKKPSKKLSARTDRDGRVTFRLPIGGAWLVKAVHMIPAPPDAHADWQSFWASSTFELGDANGL
jgi:hypothetical protein